MQSYKTGRIISDRESHNAWDWLETYRSVPYVTNLLMKWHSVPKNQKGNVQKQAEQIRYCIQQAKEYRDASKTVSLATKPLLLYYSCMCLALAEILVKQDGTSSLDVARESHRHHGLLFSENIQKQLTVEEKFSSIRAKPMIKDGARMGTFELWRRTAQYASLIGLHTTQYHDTNVSNKSTEVLLTGSNISDFPLQGLTLLECFTHLPWLQRELSTYNISGKVVRGVVIQETSVLPNDNFNSRLKFITHPTTTALLWEVFDHFKIEPWAWKQVDISESPAGGFVVTINGGKGVSPQLSVPECFQKSVSEVGFLPPFCLNEFGTIYVSLYIIGNLARYFPDKWILEIESSSEFSVLIKSFLNNIEDRMALLTLGELSNSVYAISD
ncbi:MAG: hypothetical protein JSU04_18605 [Bdellovibrionales bacterium]|nr:hypothetical protein [Bdellovibrionales bacterium]